MIFVTETTQFKFIKERERYLGGAKVRRGGGKIGAKSGKECHGPLSGSWVHIRALTSMIYTFFVVSGKSPPVSNL